MKSVSFNDHWFEIKRKLSIVFDKKLFCNFVWHKSSYEPCVVTFEFAFIVDRPLHSWNTIINPLITIVSIETNCSVTIKSVISCNNLLQDCQDFHNYNILSIIYLFMYVWKWHASFNNTKISCIHVQHKLSFCKYLSIYVIIVVSVSENFILIRLEAAEILFMKIFTWITDIFIIS